MPRKIGEGDVSGIPDGEDLGKAGWKAEDMHAVFPGMHIYAQATSLHCGQTLLPTGASSSRRLMPKSTGTSLPLLSIMVTRISI